APPNIPFWRGEAPGRTNELSHNVSDLREHVDRMLDGVTPHQFTERHVLSAEKSTNFERHLATEVAGHSAPKAPNKIGALSNRLKQDVPFSQSFFEHQSSENIAQISAGGAEGISPARQRWVGEEKSPSPEGAAQPLCANGSNAS